MQQPFFTVHFCIPFLFGLAVVLATGPMVQAQSDQRASVRVDGRAVFRVGPLDGETADARRQRIEQRIGHLLNQPNATNAVAVERSNQNPDQWLIVVSGSDAHHRPPSAHLGQGRKRVRFEVLGCEIQTVDRLLD